MPPFVMLLIAIIAEVIATSSLRTSEGFTKLVPSIFVILGYSIAFYLVAQVLKAGMALGTTYAIWSGLGTALTAIIGVIVWNEPVTFGRVVGILLVIAGVVVLNLWGGAAHS